MPDADDKKTKSSHTLADHALGADLTHVHEGDADHDHDDIDPGPLEENPIWIADHVTLMSVGIDIGSSGTQVVFSRVKLRRLGEELTSRYYVVARETLFQSKVALTPYQSVNSVTHMWGYRNYKTDESSRNNVIVGYLSNGEGWHNNHHADPRSARHGHLWWEFDLTWHTIRLLALLGLARRIIVPSPHLLAELAEQRPHR